jgi:hypothetical protein
VFCGFDVYWSASVSERLVHFGLLPLCFEALVSSRGLFAGLVFRTAFLADEEALMTYTA